MKYITRLKTTSLYNDLLKKYHFVLISVICLLVILNQISKHNIFNMLIIIIVLLLILIKLYIHQKQIFLFTLIILILITSNYFLRKYIYNNTNFNASDIYQIIKIEPLEKTNKILLKHKNTKYIIYTKENLKVGMNIHIEGELESVSTEHVPYGFNYKDYLFKNNIKGIIKVNSIKIINQTKNIHIFHDVINNYFDNIYTKETNGFLKALLIGNKNNLDSELLENISNIGIGHLFVISGLHINIIVLIVSKFLKLLKIKEEKQFPIILIFLIIYYIITSFLISILRIIITNTLRKLNIKYNLHLSSLDIYSINILLVLIFNPLLLFSYSFILTYLISTMIVIINPILTKKTLFDSLIISVMSVLVTLPIIININPTINLLSIIYNIFYIPFVSYILLPLSIVICIIPYLEFIYIFIIKYFIIITNFLGNINFLKITIPNLNYLSVIVYFMILIKLILNIEIKHKKKIIVDFIILIIFLLIVNNKIILNNKDQIYFLDLPVGESTLIIKKYNQANILIDTGEKGSDELITFLKKKGIKKIDLLIISHGDSDHCGMLDEVVKEIKVKKIALSKYDETSLKIYNKYKNKIIFLQRNDNFNIKNISFKVLWPYKKYNNSNNNSLVLLININNLKILMTGDIEKEAEEELIELEKHIDVDVLKIAHHGSKTSTSEYFLNNINFKIGIAMTGYNNTFGFPSDIITERLKYKNVFYTGYSKTIFIRFEILSKRPHIYVL